MISFVRIDNRLIHGQVVETWLPHLKVKRLWVADDEASQNFLMKSAMGLAVPDSVKVEIESIDATNFKALQDDKVPTLLLFREVEDLLRARKKGLTLTSVNIGNVHFAEGRLPVTASVFLSESEQERLHHLQTEGIDIDIRAVPSEAPTAFQTRVAGATR